MAHRVFRFWGLFATSLLLASSAWAMPITWNITGTFADGGTLSGSFAYDADASSYSSIDVVTTAGSALGGADYTVYDPCCAPAANFLLFVTGAGDLTGTPVLSTYLASSMTDSGGTINLAIGSPLYSEESCADSTCSNPAGTERLLVSGDVSTAPEPGTFLLTLPLFALLAVLRRHRNEFSR